MFRLITLSVCRTHVVETIPRAVVCHEVVVRYDTHAVRLLWSKCEYLHALRSQLPDDVGKPVGMIFVDYCLLVYSYATEQIHHDLFGLVNVSHWFVVLVVIITIEFALCVCSLCIDAHLFQLLVCQDALLCRSLGSLVLLSCLTLELVPVLSVELREPLDDVRAGYSSVHLTEVSTLGTLDEEFQNGDVDVVELINYQFGRCAQLPQVKTV